MSMNKVRVAPAFVAARVTLAALAASTRTGISEQGISARAPGVAVLKALLNAVVPVIKP